jgi:hypothetical protein
MKKFSTAIVIIILLTMAIPLFGAPPPPTNYRISTNEQREGNEEQMWVSPTDSNIVMVVWRDINPNDLTKRVGLGRSTDAGSTWAYSWITSVIFPGQSDPCIDVDSDGNFYICFMDIRFDFTEGATISVIKSEDNGLSWSYPICLPFKYGGPLDDKEFITIDRTGGPYDGNLYMAWSFYPSALTSLNNDVMFTRLQKDSAFFDSPYVISPIQIIDTCGYDSGRGGNFAQPIVGSDGTVYVFFEFYEFDSTNCIFNYNLSMTKSTDGGVTMSSPEIITSVNAPIMETIDGGVSAISNPIAAADISGGEFDGNLYVSFADKDTSNTLYNDWNINFTRSTDNGTTWSKPYYINDDPTGMGAKYDQWHQWLFCNEEGTLIIIFYDQRLDTTDHTSFDVFAAYSFDGGESFTTNHRITDVSSNPWVMKSRSPKNSKATKIAEYIALTAFKDHINAAWTDGRIVGQQVYGANWVTPILEPRLLLPLNGDNVADGLPQFNWATAWNKADDQYRLEIATDNQFINTVQTEIIDSSGFAFTSKALEDDLYYWRVKAFKISTGDSTEYSPVWSFTTGDYICIDSDGDGFGDPNVPSNNCPDDNCPELFNLSQINSDEDSLGDSCDNCPYVTNPDQADDDEDGIGNVCEYVCGDATNNGSVNILDITFLIAYLYMNGTAPEYLIACDVNGSGTSENPQVNILDITYLIAFLYMSGAAPNCP